MGDRTSVIIEIGGTLTRAQLSQLADALLADGLTFDWGNGPDVSAEAILERDEPELALKLTGTEINYTTLDETEAFCQSHGLSYRKEWDAGCEYPAGGEIFTPAHGVIEYACGAIGDGPNLSAAEIRRLGSWDALQAHLALIEQRLPALTVTRRAGRVASDAS